MKRLQVLFLAALSSSLLLFGCGKDADDTVSPVVKQKKIRILLLLKAWRGAELQMNG